LAAEFLDPSIPKAEIAAQYWWAFLIALGSALALAWRRSD
jgi:hypothetical protein